MRGDGAGLLAWTCTAFLLNLSQWSRAVDRRHVGMMRVDLDDDAARVLLPDRAGGEEEQD